MVQTTWDILNSYGVTLSNNNLTASYVGSTDNKIRASKGYSTGKWYLEVKVINGGASLFGIVGNDLATNTSSPIHLNAKTKSYYPYANVKFPENTSYGSDYTATGGLVGKTISVLIDLDNNVLEFWKDGVSQGVSHTNLSSLQKPVYAFVSSGNAGTNVLEANFGDSNMPFKYQIPQGYNAYGNPPKSKILINNNGIYKTWGVTSSWKTLSSTASEQDYLNEGINDIASIPESAWQQLGGTVELCYFTDDSSKTEAQFNIETIPFTLADEFKGKEIKVLEYTDSPSQVESKVETEVEPYSIYDEFGDTMEVLYYTDNTTRTKADLEITANYSPLDELEGDFEVVTWSDTIDETVQISIPQLTPDAITEGTIYETQLNLENVVKVK